MQLSLPANISKLRKEHGLTQEQLAEALGVTFASVSKWERGVATPELHLIGEMADLFGVSFDALVGFEARNGSAAALEDRIRTLLKQKKCEEAAMEAEKALLRYPNDFRIVHRAGDLYACAGIEQNNQAYMRRAIELLERSIPLLSQNADPDVSQVSIQNEIAQCYIVLGQTQKGIEILKAHNVSGVHNSLIALTLTGGEDASSNAPDLESAVPFMSRAFDGILSNALRTLVAFANYHSRKGDELSCRDSLLWLIHFLESVKVDGNLPCYFDRAIAPCYAECANLSLRLGEADRVEPYMRKAYQAARLFDSAPTFQMTNIKFCLGEMQNATSYDNMGECASAAVEKQIAKSAQEKALLEIWERIAAEEEAGGTK